MKSIRKKKVTISEDEFDIETDIKQKKPSKISKKMIIESSSSE
jgi:hypothetical protein